MPSIQPVILCGGAGTRLWPASRAQLPKQLLPLLGERTMLQDTALRLQTRADIHRQLLLVCNEDHRFLVAEQLRAIDCDARIVLEPAGRNTAPAAALAALLAVQDAADGDAPLLLIMPADHVVRDTDAFLEAVAAGEPAAAAGQIVMFGIVPSYPHTGYGYIEADAKDTAAAPIRSFIEKPDQKAAVALLETNRFFWNSGIFLFRADTFLDELAAFEPEMLAACRASLETGAEDKDYLRPEASAFRACPANSIDYAVMEKTTRGAMVPMTAGWSDVGSWSALHDVSDQDEDGNAITGDVLAHQCRSSYLHSSHRLLAAVGLENVVVVEDKDAVLVVARDRTQDVKAISERLKAANRQELVRHRQRRTPWGSIDDIDAAEGYQVRRLVVLPGATLQADDDAPGTLRWLVLRGRALVATEQGGNTLQANESVVVCAGQRLENTGDSALHLLEIEIGELSRR